MSISPILVVIVMPGIVPGVMPAIVPVATAVVSDHITTAVFTWRRTSSRGWEVDDDLDETAERTKTRRATTSRGWRRTALHVGGKAVRLHFFTGEDALVHIVIFAIGTAEYCH